MVKIQIRNQNRSEIEVDEMQCRKKDRNGTELFIILSWKKLSVYITYTFVNAFVVVEIPSFAVS
jgi:hypothetical protein